MSYDDYYGYPVDLDKRRAHEEHHTLKVGELVCKWGHSIGVITELRPGYEQYNVRVTGVGRDGRPRGSRVIPMSLPQKLDAHLARIDQYIARYTDKRNKLLLRRAAVIEREYLMGDPDRKLAAETTRLKAKAAPRTKKAKVSA